MKVSIKVPKHWKADPARIRSLRAERGYRVVEKERPEGVCESGTPAQESCFIDINGVQGGSSRGWIPQSLAKSGAICAGNDRDKSATEGCGLFQHLSDTPACAD